MRERERETERQRDRETERQRQRLRVCERERERKGESYEWTRETGMHVTYVQRLETQSKDKERKRAWESNLLVSKLCQTRLTDQQADVRANWEVTLLKP